MDHLVTGAVVGALIGGGFVAGAITTAVAMTVAQRRAAAAMTEWIPLARGIGYTAGAREAYEVAHRYVAHVDRLGRANRLLREQVHAMGVLAMAWRLPGTRRPQHLERPT